MKKLFLLVTLSLAVPFGAFAQYWSAQPPTPQITVSGSAEVKVVPDEIRISVGVETRDADLNTAKSQHDERMKSALGFLRKSGIPEKDIQTDYINIAPDYNYDSSRVKPVVYIVRKSIEIKLTSVTNLESTLTGLLNNGANYVHNVDFRTTQLRKHRDEARAMAIHAAKEKAEALAKELGVKCGKPLNISANDYSGSWYGGSYWGGRGYGFYNQSQNQNVVQNMGGGPSDSAGDTLSVGQISVSATVNVSFAIQ